MALVGLLQLLLSWKDDSKYHIRLQFCTDCLNKSLLTAHRLRMGVTEDFIQVLGIMLKRIMAFTHIHPTNMRRRPRLAINQMGPNFIKTMVMNKPSQQLKGSRPLYKKDL